jgi:hypothetical protein
VTENGEADERGKKKKEKMWGSQRYNGCSGKEKI